MRLKKTLFLSMLLAISVVLAAVESLIGFNHIPGVKLGLANVIIVLLLYEFSFKDAFIISILRVFIVSFILGKFLMPQFYMSLFGAFFSILIMLILKKGNKFSIIFISCIGSLFHSIGQLFALSLFFNEMLTFYYLPIMGMLSMITGIVIGLIAKRIILHYHAFFNNIEN